MANLVSEQQIIEMVRRAFRPAGRQHHQSVLAGIGDDAAILKTPAGSLWAVSTDAFLEDVHFLPRVHAPDVAGAKALARAVSDLAAVGAVPLYFLLSLALPRQTSPRWLRAFVRGMAAAARRYRIVLVGGDTTRPRVGAGISANFTVIGETHGYSPVLRSGARAGDLVFVSGITGAAQLGLELVRRGLWRDRRWPTLLRRHLRPEPRVELGQWLARNKLATAMIDTSDGLSTDLRNLCAASKVGARLNIAALPQPKIPPALQRLQLDPLQLALHGGDDYELLFTVSPRNRSRVPARFRNVSLTQIGRITRQNKMVAERGGKLQPLPARGWDPFR